MIKQNNHGRRSALVFDARGNGEGMISPTITGDHQNRITDYTAIVVECFAQPGYGKWVKQDVSDPIRASGGDIGGGERNAHLLYSDTIGALCARDFKGVGSQYVYENKLVIDNVNSSETVQ